MSKLSYQRLIRATFNNYSRNEMPKIISADLLNEVLALPHPQREIAFVNLQQYSHSLTALLSSESIQERD